MAQERQGRMKIATFNVNDVVKRLANLTAWLSATKPDIVCLQELKAEAGAFPKEALASAGYGAVWAGERRWNGVAILARQAQSVLTRSRLPGDACDRQARYIEAAVNGILIGSVYLPNGNPQPGPKFDYKLAWFERLIAHAGSLVEAGIPAVLAGDFNVVPGPEDIYPTRSMDGNAVIHSASRAAFRRLLHQGWVDSLRVLQPEGPALDLLALSAAALARRQRHAPGPSPALARAHPAAGGRRRRSPGPRRG